MRLPVPFCLSCVLLCLSAGHACSCAFLCVKRFLCLSAYHASFCCFRVSVRLLVCTLLVPFCQSGCTVSCSLAVLLWTYRSCLREACVPSATSISNQKRNFYGSLRKIMAHHGALIYPEHQANLAFCKQSLRFFGKPGDSQHSHDLTM